MLMMGMMMLVRMLLLVSMGDVAVDGGVVLDVDVGDVDVGDVGDCGDFDGEEG